MMIDVFRFSRHGEIKGLLHLARIIRKSVVGFLGKSLELHELMHEKVKNKES